jgi:ubiquitin thioesterase OTU1
VHYDALGRNKSEHSPESTDQTVFTPDDADAFRESKALAHDLFQQRQFVNLSGCDLRCLVCGRGLRGQKEAIEHAKTTGHQNFGQT